MGDEEGRGRRTGERRARWLRAKSPIRRKEIVVGGGGGGSEGRRRAGARARDAAGEGTAHAKRQNLDGMERQKCLWVARSHQVSPWEGRDSPDPRHGHACYMQLSDSIMR